MLDIRIETSSLCFQILLLPLPSVLSLSRLLHIKTGKKELLCYNYRENIWECVSAVNTSTSLGVGLFFPLPWYFFPPFAFAVFKLWPLWEKQWLKWKVRTNCVKTLCCQNMNMMKAVLGRYKARVALHTQKIKIK